MKTFLLAVVFAAAAMAQSPLAGAKTVFLLPMPSGLDQYLAVRLTEESSLTVVTKADKADLIMTDHISSDLEKSLAPAPDAKDSNTFARPSMSPLSRAKGTMFLVDRQTGDVVWSTLEQPKSSSPSHLKAAASRIVERLNKARAGKN